jgi:hypothetical protein
MIVPERSFAAHRGAVWRLAFAADGTRLASGSWGAAVLIRDVSDLHPAGP